MSELLYLARKYFLSSRLWSCRKTSLWVQAPHESKAGIMYPISKFDPVYQPSANLLPASLPALPVGMWKEGRLPVTMSQLWWRTWALEAHCPRLQSQLCHSP